MGLSGSLDDTDARPRDQVRVFYSYSHCDEAFRQELGKHLALFKRAGLISEWHDRRIAPGEEWASEININLEQADIILLLISADFLASDYCFDVELGRALERHEGGSARVVPIIIRSVSWQSAPFGKLQALPTGGKAVDLWDNADAAWTNIAEGIQAVIESLPPLPTEIADDDDDLDMPTMVRGLVAKDVTDFILLVEAGLEYGEIFTTKVGDVIVIGRDHESHIHLDPEDKNASRHHACIEVSAKGFAVHDLKSKNGTYVNNKRVNARRLQLGDRVRCGSTVVRLAEPPDPNRTLTMLVPKRGRA